MMLSTTLETSFDFVPHTSSYLTASVFFGGEWQRGTGSKCIHSFHPAISQANKLNCAFHDF